MQFHRDTSLVPYSLRRVLSRRPRISRNIRTLPSRSPNLRNQAINVLDFSVLKNFALTERAKLQFRVELLTTLNVLPREFQLGLKLLF